MNNKSLAVNAFSVDLEDWYQGIELPIEAWGAHANRLRYGVDPLLQLLGMHNVSATTAVLILKEDVILDNPALFVMNFAYSASHEETFLFILDSVIKKRELVDLEFNLIFKSAISKLNPQLKRIGFQGVPSKLNPRMLNLLARNSSEISQDLFLEKKDWLLTLGDWDFLETY